MFENWSSVEYILTGQVTNTFLLKLVFVSKALLRKPGLVKMSLAVLGRFF